MEKRFDYKFAVNEYQKLSKYLEEKNLKCDPSGSLRRKKNNVGDIDFVVEGDTEEVIVSISKYHEIEKQIDEYEFLLKSGIIIHAIPEKKSEYTYTLWHSTGPKSHVRFIEKLYSRKGITVDKEIVDEKEIYAKVGLKYLSPEERYKIRENKND